jgi:hypothetical protein
MNAKLITLIVITATLAGCAGGPTLSHNPVKVVEGPDVKGTYRLQGYKGPEAMENMEVMQASRDCIVNRMRPNVSYLMVRTDQGKTRVPVSVVCEPF